MIVMSVGNKHEGEDRLARRQSIIDGFKTPRQFAERIMQLEDECRAIRAEYERNETPPCQFPEHRDAYGNVTHQRYLGTMEGHDLRACEVCGTVRAEAPVLIAGTEG
jgi:hypothetical protein